MAKLITNRHPLRTQVASYAYEVRAATIAAGTKCMPVRDFWDRGILFYYCETLEDHLADLRRMIAHPEFAQVPVSQVDIDRAIAASER